MAWETPKTDWYGVTDEDGNYTGDRFNAEDYNRIKNNIEYLREIAIALYDEFDIVSVGADKTPADYFYADEINQLDENLRTVNQQTLNMDIEKNPVYADNTPTMTFEELNRLEKAILDLYDRLHNQFVGRRMFTWNFGMRGGAL